MQKKLKTGIIVFLCLFNLAVQAQKEKVKEKDGKVKEKSSVTGAQNIIKINLPALVLKNFSVQYERQVGRKTSVALNVRTIPFGKLPLQNSFNDLVDNSDVQYDQFKLGSFGLVPEFRYYLSRKGALHGFYVGPFFNYSNYKMNLPITYQNGATNKTGIFNGKLNAYTGGIQFGTQFSLGKNVVLDWWILGPNFGSARGTLTFAGQLSTQEQADLRQELEDLKNDAPLNTIKSYTVNANGATVVAQGPWAGLRGLGLSLGIRF